MAVGVLICAVDVLVGVIQLSALRAVVASVARRKTTNNPSFLRTCAVPTWLPNPSFTPPTRGMLGGTEKGQAPHYVPPPPIGTALARAWSIADCAASSASTI